MHTLQSYNYKINLIVLHFFMHSLQSVFAVDVMPQFEWCVALYSRNTVCFSLV
jgi:hypothetical protein